ALAPRAQSPTYTLGRERSSAGEEPSAVVTLQPFPEWLALALELPPYETSTTFRIRLLVAGSVAPLWEGQLESEAEGRARLQVHSTWLEPGIYTLELVGLDAAGSPEPALRYPFRVRRED
ncbi:MAG: hypothetical protein MI919_34375, partial [Holophagales bacterium]|nr:hypothetical protein [Holophagales bacterium]